MFDLNTPSALFFHIGKTLEDYSCNKSKKVSDLFFLIMSLNHLREWIAPDYKAFYNIEKRQYEWPNPKNHAEKFSLKIYNHDDFKIFRNVCNGTKHLAKQKLEISTDYKLSVKDWEVPVKDIRIFGDGPPSGFEIDGFEIEILLKKIYKYYNDNWFAKNNT